MSNSQNSPSWLRRHNDLMSLVLNEYTDKYFAGNQSARQTQIIINEIANMASVTQLRQFCQRHSLDRVIPKVRVAEELEAIRVSGTAPEPAAPAVSSAVVSARPSSMVRAETDMEPDYEEEYNFPGPGRETEEGARQYEHYTCDVGVPNAHADACVTLGLHPLIHQTAVQRRKHPELAKVADVQGKGIRAMNWFVTYFFSPETKVEPVVPVEPSIRYYVTKLEVCPETKREHGHAYVEFKSLHSTKQVSELFAAHTGQGCWCAPCRGGQEAAIRYVLKSGSTHPHLGAPVSYGLRKQQGHRGDLDAMLELVFAGCSKYEVLRAHGGNALRHMGMIDRAQRAVHGWDGVDNAIMNKRVAYAEADADVPIHMFRKEMTTRLDEKSESEWLAMVSSADEKAEEEEAQRNADWLKHMEYCVAHGIPFDADGGERPKREKKALPSPASGTSSIVEHEADDERSDSDMPALDPPA